MDSETFKIASVIAIVVLAGAGLLRVYGKWARRNPGSNRTNKLTRTGIAVYGLFAVAMFVGLLGAEFLGEDRERPELWSYIFLAVIGVAVVVASIILRARGLPLTKDEDNGGV
jgi:quinol-cytochrome oxidoreductase complex cytochrome b subunit